MPTVGRLAPLRPTLRTAVLAALATLCLASALPAGAAEPRSGEEISAEQQFLSLANASRSQAGLPPLSQSSAWLDHARNHSEDMARSASLYHDPALQAEAGTVGCWEKVGENVGRGPSVEAIHTALVASPTHRANLLGSFDSVGIGVEVSGGVVYVTQRFLKACGAVAAPAVPVPAAAPAQPASVPPPPLVREPAAAAAAATPLEPSRGSQPERHGGSFTFAFDLGV